MPLVQPVLGCPVGTACGCLGATTDAVCWLAAVTAARTAARTASAGSGVIWIAEPLLAPCLENADIIIRASCFIASISSGGWMAFARGVLTWVGAEGGLGCATGGGGTTAGDAATTIGRGMLRVFSRCS